MKLFGYVSKKIIPIQGHAAVQVCPVAPHGVKGARTGTISW